MNDPAVWSKALLRKTMKILASLLFAFGLSGLFAQEALLSHTEKYYDFLALDGFTERPYLNYRTLSDSSWKIEEESGSLWDGRALETDRNLSGKLSLRIYGPELFASFNGASPYGTNDGALWQGRGLNSNLTGGARLEGYGLEVTIKPNIVFSQNLSFDILQNNAYKNPWGYIWSYGYGIGADSPQRFGDKAILGYSWGDSEIRYTWRQATIGFGTQSPWVGPGRINSIMHSNNAPPYPKLDLGFRRVPLKLFGWYAGDIEARLFEGYLSESAFFDADSSNDHNLISFLSLAWAPSFLPGLTLCANRSYLAPWKAASLATIPGLVSVSLTASGSDVWDQRAELGFDYLLPKAGVEFYGEIGLNDTAASLTGYIRYPFHSMVYSGGFRKSILVSESKSLRGELSAEWTNLELSQDFQFQWPATFYMHYLIAQGYTNGGQWLGAGIGTGGNSQYLGFRLYYPVGSTEFFVQRVNPDNDYLYRLTIQNGPVSQNLINDFRADFSIGLRTHYIFPRAVTVDGGAVFITENNPLYNGKSYYITRKRYSLRIEAGLSYRI